MRLVHLIVFFSFYGVFRLLVFACGGRHACLLSCLPRLVVGLPCVSAVTAERIAVFVFPGRMDEWVCGWVGWSNGWWKCGKMGESPLVPLLHGNKYDWPEYAMLSEVKYTKQLTLVFMTAVFFHVGRTCWG